MKTKLLNTLLYGCQIHCDILVAGPSRAQTRLRIVLSAIGMLSMVVALMRPVSFGLATIEEQSVEADVVIALDLSKSMWAEDAAPNRLEQAKYEIMEMVDAMLGIGLDWLDLLVQPVCCVH